ncbi:DNA N6-methyl methyltransferase [Sitodiplosis mosellana]|uniref:DNA N6-methyl methyltransferase n=1 Tax=Sitodiplosis mosellana TaxID=263140 RepID=UPI00244487C2|nr:DNA N6-methyl methyltransferase [Sitodiplosis mosellana]
MSVLFSFENCSLISHENFINRIYDGVTSSDSERASYKINPDLFELNVPYRYKTPDEAQTKKRQRKIINKTNIVVAAEHREEFELIERLKRNVSNFIAKCHEQNVLPSFERDEAKTMTNEKLKLFLDQWQSVECLYGDNFKGGNDSKKPVVVELNGTSHIVPPKCTFSNANIQNIDRIEPANGYDLVVMDPPWWNKYVRRSRKFNSDNSYQMLSNDHIASIPIEMVTQPNRTLVAIWCTNAPSMIQAVKETFLSRWNLQLLATWYWMKITKYGEPICDFDLPLKKQPFERLFIACHKDNTHDFNIPNERMIFSVPSSIHSHKPPLQDLFIPYFTKSADEVSCLELFARYLLPNCTSIGLEVLKLQNLQLFHKTNM